MAYRHLTYEECLRRYPRLVRALQWVACLSSSEAACAIRDYRDGKHAVSGHSPFGSRDVPDFHLQEWGATMLHFGGGEAVCHFGGPARAIERAIQTRPSRRLREAKKMLREAEAVLRCLQGGQP